VLFSEPKIPQSHRPLHRCKRGLEFQCSSASRKFLNRSSAVLLFPARTGFSALQRAENSSIRRYDVPDVHAVNVSVLFSEPKIPQSSIFDRAAHSRALSFSALQRAENSSIIKVQIGGCVSDRVSVLFSEPKIPQSRQFELKVVSPRLSVLFSEPKIPQSRNHQKPVPHQKPFQCSSASRKFLNRGTHRQNTPSPHSFSALQRAENSSIRREYRRTASPECRLSVLFSEPKIPQSGQPPHRNGEPDRFQCSSASRKFLNPIIAALGSS